MDTVVTFTPNETHRDIAVAMLEGGKNVFIEKPHAIDPSGCLRLKRVCDLARTKRLSLVSGHESRYSLAYQEQAKQSAQFPDTPSQHQHLMLQILLCDSTSRVTTCSSTGLFGSGWGRVAGT